jgi:hypothetical protein
MDKKGSRAALKVAQSGTPVPQKDFSSKKKESKAAGTSGGSKGSMSVANNLPMPTANKAPEAGVKVTEPKKTWEGSPEDWQKDYSESRRKGMKVSDYEDTASDRLSDNAGERRMQAEDSKADKPAANESYKRGTPAFSNSPKTAHGFGHPSSARDGHLRNSGHPQAHRLGKKK